MIEWTATNERFDGASFTAMNEATVSGGVIVDAVEHWVTAGGEPRPAWRSRFRAD